MPDLIFRYNMTVYIMQPFLLLVCTLYNYFVSFYAVISMLFFMFQNASHCDVLDDIGWRSNSIYIFKLKK